MTDEELAARLAERRQRQSTDEELAAKLASRRAQREQGLSAEEQKYRALLAKDGLSPKEIDAEIPKLMAAKKGPVKLEQVSDVGTAETGPARLIRGIEGATFGVDDEAAGLGAGLGALFGGGDFLPAYREGRKERQDLQDAAAKNSSLLDEIAGGAPTAMVGGAAKVAGKGVKALAKAGAKAGGIFGALSGAGHTRADLTKGEVGKFLGDTAMGSAAGATLGAAIPVATVGGAKAAKFGGAKIADFARGIAGLFGYEPAPNVGRAAEYLRVPTTPNKGVASLFENQKLVTPEQAPPSVLNQASEYAPDAMSQVSREPRTTMAEISGQNAVKNALGSISEMPWHADPELFSALTGLKQGELVDQSLVSSFGPAFAKNFGRLARPMEEVFLANPRNLNRINGNPAAKGELIRLIMRGREPNLSPEAGADILGRISSLIGSDLQD